MDEKKIESSMGELENKERNTKMGKKYKKRYEMHFANPDICEFDMQHEQWLFGDNTWTAPVLQAVDSFMCMPV